MSVNISYIILCCYKYSRGLSELILKNNSGKILLRLPKFQLCYNNYRRGKRIFFKINLGNNSLLLNYHSQIISKIPNQYHNNNNIGSMISFNDQTNKSSLLNSVFLFNLFNEYLLFLIVIHIN